MEAQKRMLDWVLSRASQCADQRRQHLDGFPVALLSHRNREATAEMIVRLYSDVLSKTQVIRRANDSEQSPADLVDRVDNFFGKQLAENSDVVPVVSLQHDEWLDATCNLLEATQDRIKEFRTELRQSK